MLEHWLIQVIGHVSGLSDAQLKQIEKSLPATKALVDLLNRARPIIEQAEKLYTEAEPLIDEAKKEWETVGPGAPRPSAPAGLNQCGLAVHLLRARRARSRSFVASCASR